MDLQKFLELDSELKDVEQNGKIEINVGDKN